MSVTAEISSPATRPSREEPDDYLAWVRATPRDGLPMLPKVTAAQANHLEGWREVPAALALLLRRAPLGDRPLAALAAAAGVGGVLHVRYNPWIGEGLWCALYDTTAGIGRRGLVDRRLLSDAQRRHVVAVARERSPWVLEIVACQLDDDELATVAAYKLPERARYAVAAERRGRADGRRAQWRNAAGRGALLVREDPQARLDATALDEPVKRGAHPLSEQAMARAATVAHFLTARFGDDTTTWTCLAEVLLSGFTGTWRELADTVTATPTHA